MKSLSSLIHGFQVVDREVKRLCCRMRLPLGRDVEHLQRHRAAFKVASRTRLFTSRDSKQLRIEGNCGFEITDFDVKPKKLWYIVRGGALRGVCLPFVLLFHWHCRFSF